MSVLSNAQLTHISTRASVLLTASDNHIGNYEYDTAKVQLEKAFSLITYLLNIIEAGDLPAKPHTEP